MNSGAQFTVCNEKQFSIFLTRNYCQWKGEERGRGIREEEVVFRISIVENSNTNFSENEEGRAENEAKMKKKK